MEDPAQSGAGLARLLAAQDEAFVRGAYRALLGREPDPQGLGEYLEQLRTGVPKLELLASLAQSREARDSATSGLALGAAAIAQRERTCAWNRVRSCADLLALWDLAFVRAAYRLLLGRDGDADGLRTYVGMLRSGEPRVDVLKALRESAEGRAAGNSRMPRALADAIDSAIRRQRWARLPWVGGIAAALSGAESYRESARRQRRLENALWRMEEAFLLPDADGAGIIATAALPPESGDAPGQVRVSSASEVVSLLTTLPPAFAVPRAALKPSGP